MSESKRPETDDDRDDDQSQGPNLKILYSLIVFALVAAIAIALMIVRPFYLRR